jgi:hypothetical protein
MIWKLAFSVESGQRPAESVDTSDPAEHSRQSWELAFSVESGQRPAESIDTSRPSEDSRQSSTL